MDDSERSCTSDRAREPLDRPALQNLLADVRAGKITIVVVYKVDRLTRSLAARTNGQFPKPGKK